MIEMGNPKAGKPLFELCVTTLEGAQAAEKGGADRIELCADLPSGGITPQETLLKSVLRQVSIPVHVLIRPRAGDFVYTAEEFLLMVEQIKLAKAAGARGVALGILLPDGRVDVARTRALVEAARPMQVTFHRAIDETPDVQQALEDVVKTGAECVLTSGGAANVLSGAPTLANLRVQAGSRIQLMAGGGLRLECLADFILRTGIRCVHGSLTRSNGKHEGNGNGSGLEDSVREAVRVLSDPSSARAHVER